MAIKQRFEDCPYNCNIEGKILDPNTGKMVPCPHCYAIKKELLEKGMAVEEDTGEQLMLSTLLGVNSRYLTEVFVYDSVIPESERAFIEEDSYEMQRRDAEELYNAMVLGMKPDKSYCFGISIKGRLDRFVYPMLAKAYKNGLTVAKCISCSEFSRLQLRMNEDLDAYINSDIVIMVLNDGCSNGDLAAAKGLMQSRALRGNPTVFVSTWTIEACSAVLSSKNDDQSLFMAYPSFVFYRRGSGNRSNYINNILGVKNGYAPQHEDGRGVSLKDLQI